MSKYDDIKKQYGKFAIEQLNNSLDKDIKKEKAVKTLKLKSEITKLPWDLGKKIIQTENYFSGNIAGKNVEFAFNEDGSMTTRIDGSLSSLENVNKLRKKLTSHDVLIDSLHSYLEAEDNEDVNDESAEEENEDDEKPQKDSLDKVDEILSKLNLSEIDNKTKIELIESIIDNIQSNCEKDEFDDIMNDLYDLLDDYYVNDEKEEEPKEEEEPAEETPPAPEEATPPPPAETPVV